MHLAHPDSGCCSVCGLSAANVFDATEDPEQVDCRSCLRTIENGLTRTK